MADNSLPRDNCHASATRTDVIPMGFKRYSSNTTGQTRLAIITMKWVLEEFQDVHKGLGQLGRPATFDRDPTVKPAHVAIHRQPVACQN